nr:hypothetical protein Iba_chr09aCG14180 [Ipomoea batatas]
MSASRSSPVASVFRSVKVGAPFRRLSKRFQICRSQWFVSLTVEASSNLLTLCFAKSSAGPFLRSKQRRWPVSRNCYARLQIYLLPPPVASYRRCPLPPPPSSP